MTTEDYCQVCALWYKCDHRGQPRGKCNTRDRSVMLSFERRAADRVERLAKEGPWTYAEADLVGKFFCEAAARAMLATNREELSRSMEEVVRWSHHLLARQRIFKEEVKRRETEQLVFTVDLLSPLEVMKGL